MNMVTTNENPVLTQIVSKLNSIESAWNNQFEAVPNTPIRFSVSGHGVLCLNDVPLDVPALEVDTDSIFVDVEHFGFCTRNAGICKIGILWPYDGVPRIDTIHRITTFPAVS